MHLDISSKVTSMDDVLYLFFRSRMYDEIDFFVFEPLIWLIPHCLKSRGYRLWNNLDMKHFSPYLFSYDVELHVIVCGPSSRFEGHLIVCRLQEVVFALKRGFTSSTNAFICIYSHLLDVSCFHRLSDNTLPSP